MSRRQPHKHPNMHDPRLIRTRVNNIFRSSVTNYINSLRRERNFVHDITGAADMMSIRHEITEQALNDYTNLLSYNAIPEAYTILRLYFAKLDTDQLLGLHARNLLLTQRDALQASQHDALQEDEVQDDPPF